MCKTQMADYKKNIAICQAMQKIVMEIVDVLDGSKSQEKYMEQIRTGVSNHQALGTFNNSLKMMIEKMIVKNAELGEALKEIPSEKSFQNKEL